MGIEHEILVLAVSKAPDYDYVYISLVSMTDDYDESQSQKLCPDRGSSPDSPSSNGLSKVSLRFDQHWIRTNDFDGSTADTRH